MVEPAVAVELGVVSPFAGVGQAIVVELVGPDQLPAVRLAAGRQGGRWRGGGAGCGRRHGHAGSVTAATAGTQRYQSCHRR